MTLIRRYWYNTLEAMSDRMRQLTEEFDRRAGAQWVAS
jgi:hypothetical protein